MSDFFKKSHPVTKFLTALANLILVNLLFIATCLPVFTIGASLCGLYTVAFEILNGEEVFILRDYFSTFKNCFTKATAIWVPVLIVDLFLGFDINIVLSGESGTAAWMIVPPCIVMLVSFFICIYAFPILSRFENSFKETVKNALLLSIGNLPTTIMIAVVHFLVVFLISIGNFFSAVLASLMFFMGFAGVALVTTFFLNHTLPKSSAIMTRYIEEDKAYFEKEKDDK